MIGRSTLLWVVLAALSGFGLYQVKYEVVNLEGRLTSLNQQIVDDQQAIHVLRAEWTLLDDPTRIQKLASTYLDMKPVEAGQIVSLNDIPLRQDQPGATPETPSKTPPAHRPAVVARVEP